MATPTEWLNEFKVNTGTADLASTSDPHILGLSNGNFLVAWTETGTSGVGTQAGLDIIGKIYDGAGNVVRDSFRINNSRNADNESDFDIGATNDGGFILVYVDNDGTDSRVVWERKNAAGNTTNSLDIVSETGSGDYDNPQIAVSNVSNASYITFTSYQPGGLLDPADEDVRGVVVSSSGTITTAEFEAAQDGGFPAQSDDQIQNAVAINDGANFEIVSAYRDASDDTVRVDVYNTAGTLQHTAVVDDTGSPHQPSVTTLSNGNIVVAWEDDGDDINYRVYNENLGVVLGKTPIDNTDANEVEVIALPNGEFVIIWDDDDGTPSIRGRKYDANGAADGNLFIIENANGSSPEVSVTGDGRVLFTWSFGFDVWASIWDPRDGAISTLTYDAPDRQFVDGDIIFGAIGGGTIIGDNGTAEHIIGQNNADSIDGNGDNDTIDGGGGNDTLEGGAGNDFIDGGTGDDLIIMRNTDGLDLIDGGTGDDTVDFTNETSTVQANLLNDFYTIGASISRSLDEIEHVNGGVGDDLLTGDNTANVLRGDLGNDILSGRDGNDTLDGQGNIDTADYTYSAPPAGPAIASSWTFDLSAGTAVFGNFFNSNIETDTLISIENIRGSGWGDRFIGAGGPNQMEGRGGNDTFVHTAVGQDTLDGGDGIDSLISDQSWVDGLEFNLDTGRIIGSNGTTLYDTLIDIENVTVGGGANITGDAEANRFEALDTGSLNSNTFVGGGGDDTLIGGIGNDSLVGDSGNDTFIDNLADGLTTIAGGSDSDTVDLSSSAAGFVYTDGAGSIADVLVGGVQRLDTSSIENLIGSDYADDITEGSLNGITAGDGNDTVTGSANGAGDLFDGGDGIDTFVAQGDQSRGYDMATGVVTNGNGAQVLNFENLTLQGGNDTVTGNDANNVIRTGAGNNVVNGSLGDDEVFGGADSDTLEGGGGADTLRGGAGVDRLVGGTENDVYFVDDANDDVIELAGEGIDQVNSWSDFALRDSSQHTENLTLLGTGDTNGTGNGLANVIRGNSGNNVLDGALGGDTIIAGDGNDTAIGGDGADRVELNKGADVFNDNAQVGPAGNDTVFGGIGADTINGGGGDDVFYGQDGNDSMTGDIGNDLLFGGAGFDTIGAGEGDDTVYGGDGQDSVELNQGADIFFDTAQTGVNGQDTVFAGIGDDTINGGGGDDAFYGQDGNDSMTGGLGNDLMFGGSGADTIGAGDGEDTVYGGDGRDDVNLGIGDDIFFDTAQTGVAGQDTVRAGDGADTIEGGGGNDSFFGGAGNDVIYGRLGNDSIYGGDNFDTIYSGDNDDLVFGGNGRDEIFMGNGSDTYVDTNQGGVNGQDTITGGAGADTFVFGATTGQDAITDFAKGVDTLRLEDALWGGGLTAQQVVNTYATDTGPDVLFDFGGGNTILLQGVANLNNLASDLDIV